MVNWLSSCFFMLFCWGIQWLGNPRIEHSSVVLSSPLSCNLIVDAGPDTNVCAPGGTIHLMGSITGNDVFYQWFPYTGLSNPFILNPTANITGPITYTLSAYGVDPTNPNLVVNGNFSGGNIGFNSDYNYVVDIPGPQNEMVPEGTYTVINNPNLVHTGFSACSDHTGGGGNMMVINGAANYQDIWCQTVTVSPDSWYNVSAWVASVNPASPAELQFSINDVPIGPIINAVSTPCTWIPFNATWNSGAATTAEICILNLNTALGGNDFALDDIAMYELCIIEDEVEITIYEEEAPEPEIDGPAFLCEGETGIYTASFPPDPPIYSYQWSVPSGATILSGQGTPTVTVLWEEAQEDEICLEIETRCDMNEACFEVIIGTVPDFPLISGPTSLCPGETATFYTPELDPDDQYDWIVPSELVIISGEGTNEIEVEWALAGEAEICLEVTNACGTTDNCTLMDLWESYLTLFDTTICEGTTIVINGTPYGNGLWSGVETFTSIHGCDSIVEIEISEATTLEFMVTANLCPGDSIFLEGAFQSIEGIYTDSFMTISGCDSLVITEVIISPFDTTWISLATCNPADTGTTIVNINQGNCDSTVITTVALSPTDTTIIDLSSCSPADTGLVMQLFSNQYGCDSMVLTSTLLLPIDTTVIFGTTCDPSGVGVTQQLLTNIYGCDSLVITTIAFLQSDTTLITDHACFIADTGTTSTLLINSMGCDSLVIIQTLYAGSDTTFLFENTCTPADSGLLVINLLNQYGCDSIISSYTTLLPSDTTYLYDTSCEPQDTGVVTTFLTNKFGCDSLVISTVTLDPIELCAIEANLDIDQPLCFGDPGVVTVSTITGLAPFTISWQHSTQPENGSEIITSNPSSKTIPLSLPGVYFFKINSANGLSQSDTIEMDAIAPLEVIATSATDLFGYHISCFGDASGVASADLHSPGTPPYQFVWSNNLTIPQLSQLSAGLYSVTVTDSHGCISSSSVTLNEPDLMQYFLESEDIRCFDQNNGTVALTNITGGISPWTTSLDQASFQNTLIYSGLSASQHHLVIRDQNGCSFEEQFIIEEPEDWHIELGSDTLIPYGSTFVIAATIIGQPFGTVHLEWSDGSCDGCLTRTITPTTTADYTVTATDENGCTHTDDIRIDVFIDRDFYVPNVFSPNGDQVNDYFKITPATPLHEVEEMTIYDRWGDLVFQEFHFQPDDRAFQWDGTMNGKKLNPGVYVYKLIVVHQDLRKEVRFGDVTLVR